MNKGAENQLGLVSVDDSVIDELRERWNEQLSGVEIISEHQDWAVYRPGVTIFKCRSAEFDPLEPGQSIPQYTFIFHRDEDGNVTREPAKRV